MQNWKKSDEKLVYNGYRKIIRKTFEMPDGSLMDYDIIKSNGGAAILAVTEDNKILCFKQFRPGPEAVLYELPGGGIEADEAPLDAMSRELREETGYVADIEYVGSYCRDAYVTANSHIFIGRNAKKVAYPQQDSTEFGEILLLDIDEFKEKLFAGLMSDTTAGYAGLLRLGLLENAIR